MLTRMTENDWTVVLEVFDASKSRRGEPGHNDRKFLEALHFFTVHNLTWRALPAEYGNWNSIGNVILLIAGLHRLGARAGLMWLAASDFRQQRHQQRSQFCLHRRMHWGPRRCEQV